MFNLVNHSDTIACVLFELLVIWNWFTWVSKPTIRFHKFQFCSIFKVLLAVRISRDSLFIISHEVPFVKNFFEIFWSFFRSQSPEKPSKAVVMRFSAAVVFALAPDSLTIIPPRKAFVNTFFQIFCVFSHFFQKDVASPFLVMVGVSYHIFFASVNTEVLLLLRSTIS